MNPRVDECPTIRHAVHRPSSVRTVPCANCVFERERFQAGHYFNNFYNDWLENVFLQTRLRHARSF